MGAIAVLRENGEDVTLMASMAKLKAGRLAREVSDMCLQFHGGMGYTNVRSIKIPNYLPMVYMFTYVSAFCIGSERLCQYNSDIAAGMPGVARLQRYAPAVDRRRRRRGDAQHHLQVHGHAAARLTHAIQLIFTCQSSYSIIREINSDINHLLVFFNL